MYCQVPVCGASRASLMTGILPTARRFRSYKTRADQDVPNATSLPQTLKDAGYTTISNGKIFHHRGDCDERSWSEPAWRPEIDHLHSHDPETARRLSKRKRGRIYESPDVPDDAYLDGHVAQKTIHDLRRLKQAGKPFFLACGFIRPHMPFYAPKKYWDLYERDKIEIADNRYRPKGAPKELRGSGEYASYHRADFKVNSDAWHRMMRHGYLACTSYVDKLTGDILAELERLGLADNTIVVIWGDHGWHLGEHNFWGKHNTMHLSTRVPLIVKVPGKEGGSFRPSVRSPALPSRTQFRAAVLQRFRIVRSRNSAMSSTAASGRAMLSSRPDSPTPATAEGSQRCCMISKEIRTRTRMLPASPNTLRRYRR